jgi:hypothetical protein
MVSILAMLLLGWTREVSAWFTAEVCASVISFSSVH